MRPLSWLFRFSTLVVVSSLAIAAITVGVVPRVVDALHAHEQEPITLPPFKQLAQRSYVYNDRGQEIAYFEQENSQPITLAQVPKPVIAAVLAVEDKEFFDHKGVNLRSLVRAILNNVQTGTSRQGASTITQQVVKLEYLSGSAIKEDGARYKLLQARYAVMLEKQMSKDQILQRYLNTVFFGNNAYGIQAAAEVYFGKEAKDLSLVEGAFLAGLIRAPSSYDPITKPERSRARFRQSMDRIEEEGLMPAAEANKVASDFPLPSKAQRAATRQYTPTHFTVALREYLLTGSDLLGKTPEERSNNLYRGGLRIYSTQDPSLQSLAEQAKATKLPQNSAGINAAVVSLDTTSGAIRAMVGGDPFQKGSNEVNLALSTRQTGSSIKIFILAAAVQAGALPTDIIDGTAPCTLPNPGDPKDPFTITDAVSGGVAALESQTWRSINCAYARLSQIVGLNRVVDTAHRMGVKSELKPYASFATGANEVSPLDMASGAQTIANRGLHHDPYYVEKITNSAGKLLYQHKDAGTQVLTPEAADTEVSILKGVLTKGTARAVGPVVGHPSAGKTGTQAKNTNAWFIGFTPALTTSVWVGDPKGYTSMTNIPEFRRAGVGNVQGATFPARIWKAYMDPALAFQPALDWPAPPKPGRSPGRLYLPGNECLAAASGGGQVIQTQGTLPDGTPDPAIPEIIAPPVLTPVESGTTVPANVLDPYWPLPLAPAGATVYNCSKGLPLPPPAPVVTGPTNSTIANAQPQTQTPVTQPAVAQTATAQP